MVTIEVKPTRSELIKLKQRIKLAKSGYNILKKKRDGLILEFFDILKRAKTIRKELIESYKEALHKVNIARAAEGDIAVRSVGLSIVNTAEIGMETRNIMGVTVPRIKAPELRRNSFERGYGFIGVSARIDEAAEAFEIVVEQIIRAAEIETSMKKLLREIEKTKRRVNALEYEIIPKLEKIRMFISLRLEEMERENIFRLKRIKKKAESSA